MGVACECSFVELVPLNGGQCYSRADNLSCDFLESAGSLTSLSTVNITLKDCRAIYKPLLHSQ